MNKLLSCLKVIIGNFLLAVSVCYFVLPHDILSGGTAGIALILNRIFHINETISIDVITIATFISGCIFLGKEFGLKTFLSALTYPIAISILNMFPYYIEGNEILISCFGALIAGVGIGIVLRENASTGGTEIPPLIIHKFTKIPVTTLFLITDATLVVAGLITYSFEDVMLGLIYIYISNMVIDKISGPTTNTAISLYIISDQTEKICDYIHKDLYRGTTILQGRGGFTNEEKDVILTVISKKQYKDLSEKIIEFDKYAFVIVSDAKEVKGEGFTYEYRV